MFSLYLDGMNIGNDYATALSLAKSRAVDWVRNLVESILSESDIRVRVCREHLTIDRSDEAAIEKYYNVLADRKQVRDSSNEAQDLIISVFLQMSLGALLTISTQGAPLSRLLHLKSLKTLFSNA